MASLYDKIKKKSDKDAQQNRVNRVTRKAKEFNGGKYNATHKSYIKGDVKSSASTRAYGYKKYGMPEHTNFTGGRDKYRYAKLQKGENPYEAKYLWTGKKSYVPGGKREDGSKYKGFMSKTRQLTDDEKKAYKATGDIDVEAYDRTHNYSFWRSYNKDAKTFDEHSNLTKDGKFLWDGMEVARNKVNNGGSKFNYLGGFLKDIIIDPLREGIRHVDKLSSAGMGAIAGGIEESANLFEAIADPNIKIKDNVNFNRSKENFLKSIEQSNKEGWGRGMGEYFDDAHERNVAKEINRLKNSSDYTEEHKKKLIKELENSRTDGTHKAFRSIAGFAGDVATPFDLGGAVVGGLKKAGKATLKSGKELLNGTSDVTTAFRVDGGKTQAMLDKFAKRMEGVKASKKGEAIDALTGNQEPSKPHKIINSLNNEYERVMSKTDNIVKEVKSNPSTENLGSFLEAIGKSDKGVQKHIDGRVLNKRYTQTKDGYAPKLSTVDDVIEHTPNVDKNQMSFFNRNGNTNTYMKNITPNTRKYEQWYDAYNGNEDMLFDMIDGLSDSNSDSMLDWLKNRDPLAYKKYMSGADTIDDFADTGVNVNKIKSKAYDKQIKEITSIKPRNNIKFDVAKTDAMKEENAIEKLVKLFSDEATPKTYKNSIERNKAFREYVGQFSDDLFNGKVDIDDLSNTIKQVRGKDVPAKVKREFINNKLFGGNNVIASSVSNSSIDAFLESLEDISNLKRVANEYMKTGEILPVQLSSATKKFLNIGDDLKIKGGKVRGDKIDSPEDLLITLTNSIYDRSRALTDERYGEKLQLMAKVFGYEDYYRDVVNKLDDLTSELKSLDKLPITKENLSRKLELSENIKRLKQVKADRTKMWESIKNLPESNFDKYISEKYPHHMKDMKAYSPRAKGSKILDRMSRLDGYEETVRKAKADYYDRKTKMDRDDIIVDLQRINKTDEAVYSTRDKKTDIEKIRKAEDKEEREYASKIVNDVRKELGLKYVDFNKINVPKDSKQTYSLLTKTKGVKDALENIKKLVLKETKLRVEGYSKDASIVRDEMLYFVKKLDEANIDRRAWFGEMKKIKDSFNVKPATKEDIFEKTGLVINGKVGTKGSKQNPLFMEELNMEKRYKDNFFNDEFERVLESIAPKDLLNANHNPRYIGEVAQHGDNIGGDIVKNIIDKIPDVHDVQAVEDVESVSNEVLDKLPQGKLKTFLNGISSKLEGSDLSKESIETILESKKKRYLKNNGVAELNNPLHKTYHVTDGELPGKFAKRLDNGNVVDFITGETKYSSANKGEFKDILEQNKYHYKNLEENDILADFIVSGKQDISTITVMFDRLNIKYNLNDPKSIDKAVNRLDWIIDKKMKEGVIDLDKAQRKLDYAVKGSYTRQTEKDFARATKDSALEKMMKYDASPKEHILDKMYDNIIKEGERLEQPFKEAEKHEKEFAELVDSLKQAETRAEKQAMFERLMQQSEYAYDSSNHIDYIDEMIDWLNNKGGLEIREKNEIMDLVKREQLRLADKGIDPNVIENKEMRKRMRANQYSKQTNIDVDKATAKQKDMQNIIEKEKNRKVSKDVLDKFDKKGTMLDEIKAGKHKKSASLREAEKKVAENIELDKKMDKLINQVISKETKKKSAKTTKKIENNVSKNAEQMLKNEASPKVIGEQLDADIKRMEDDGSLFKKFKEWYADGNDVAYDDNILYDTYKRWLNSWKKGLTVYNPGWHVQNFFQNKGQSYLGLGTDAFKSQKEAREMLKAIKGEPNKAKTILNKHGIAYTPEDITKLVQDFNVVDGLGNDVRQARGIFSDLETKVDNSGIMQFLNKNEETARLHHFMTKLKRGSTPEEALKSVNKYLFDYSKQNKFDRAMNDFVDPFWTFHKNNARLLTTQAIENPDKIGAIQRGIRGLQNDVDEQDKAYPQYRSIQSPVGQFTDSKNKDKYNYQYDLNLFPEFEKAIPLDKDGLMTKVNPLIKLAYQQANGVGEFDNKIVDKDVSKFGEVTKDENTLDMLLTINPFMNPLFKTFDKTSNHQDKVKEGKQTQETTDKQIMMEWLAYMFGNKGNYYRDLR